MYDYYEPLYYEPSEADIILSEYQNKMKEILLDSIKADFERISSENIRLSAENQKLKDKENEVDRKARELKYKEDNLKREVENEFYKTNIGNILERYIEDCELWFADKKQYRKKKCNLCNKDRKLIAEFPNGKKSESDCDCAKYYYKYKPYMTTEQTIKIYKRNSNYSSERRFYFTKSYIPSKNSYSYDDSYSEFKIGHVVDVFDDNTKKIYEDLRYGEKLGFRNKDECQKFCNWLNENNKDYENDDEDIEE
jgi:regulator of replication initiation timing